MGQRVRRRRARLGHLGPAAAPLRGHLHQRPQLSAQGPPQALRWRWCPRVILLALLPTHEPVPETTSALDPGQGAAGAQLGPRAVALASWLSKGLGVPAGKIAKLLAQLGLGVTAGGVVQ